MTIALIDYGAGNLHSVANALTAAGAIDLAVTADPDVVAKAERIVLPGVGAFGACAGALGAIGGVRVHMLSLSATGINLTLVVDDEQVKPAMQRLHAAFFDRSAS